MKKEIFIVIHRVRGIEDMFKAFDNEASAEHFCKKWNNSHSLADRCCYCELELVESEEASK